MLFLRQNTSHINVSEFICTHNLECNKYKDKSQLQGKTLLNCHSSIDRFT